MAVGPELVSIQASEIEAWLASSRVKKVEAGDMWAALFFSRDRVLFFSWDPEWYGLCSASPADVRELRGASSSRPPIADALKSHLVGSSLVSASALGRDRVLMASFARAVGAGASVRRTLVLEASARYSSAVLLDEDDVVIESAKHIYPEVNRWRTIAPGHRYAPPPPIQGVPLDEYDPARDDLRSVIGLGRPLIDAVLSAGDRALEEVPLMREARGPFVMQIIKKYASAFPIALPGSEVLSESSSLDAARRVVIAPLAARRSRAIASRASELLDAAVRRTERRIAEAEHLASDDGSPRLMELGRLLLANAASIAPRAERAELIEWTEDGERTVEIELDPELDAVANAEKLFARGRKRRAAAERARESMPALLAERAELAEQTALLSCCSGASALAAFAAEIDASYGRRSGTRRAKKHEALPPHGRVDVERLGASITWGLSARGNRYVTFRAARPDDIWLHVKDAPGSHVLLRFSSMPDEAAYDAAIALAASCAVHFSRARGERIAVDFTERRHVRAIAGTTSRVTYKEFSTVTADAGPWTAFERERG